MFLAVGALVATSIPLLACDIGVKPSAASGRVGDVVEVVVAVQQTHRTCVVPIEDTQFVLSGVQLLSETQWTQTSSMAYEKQLTVELASVGEGRIEVVRVCSKGGDRTAATISIEPAAAHSSSLTSNEPQGEAQPVPMAPITGEPSVVTPLPAPAHEVEDAISMSSIPGVVQSPSMTESLWQALQQPYIVVLLALMASGTFFLAKGYRRARPFAMLIAVGFLGFYVGGCPCTLGSFQNVFIHVGDVAAHATAYVQFGAVVLVTLLFGRVFCGWGCPLGATQFFLFRKERSGKNRWIEIAPEHHRILRWSKYGVLLVLIGLVILTGQPVFEEIDPFRILFNLDFRWGVPLVFLVVVLVASVIIGFPFCKYLCPLGAFLGLLQPLSLFKLRIAGACTNCNLCSTVACDHGAIEPGAVRPTINQMECVRCGECLSRCPRGAISLAAARPRQT